MSAAPRPTEDGLIARYFAPLAGPGGLGLLDDAALLTPTSGHDLVLTVDALVAGVHFLPDDPPISIARKALGVNLSDLAAKGAVPRGFLLALALPDGWTEDWLAEFARGLGEGAGRWACPLLGGDTVRAAGPLTVSVTALGEVPTGTMVRRTTAKPGDLVCVTGTIGDAALGLAVLTVSPTSPSLQGSGECVADTALETWTVTLDDRHRDFLADRYRHPQPRLALAAALQAHASAAMDVSDGLAGDLAKLLRASGLTGTLDLDLIPLSPAAQAALAVEASLLGRIAGGGDDYEILFTLPPERLDAMTREAAAADLAVTAVGEVRDGEEPLALRLNGSDHAMASLSYQHFEAAAP